MGLISNVYDYYITPEEYNRAAKNGVTGPLLEVRIRNLAWDKEKAIIKPPHKKNPIKDWVEIAEKNGICYSTLRYRTNRLGWDIQRAATQSIQDRVIQAKKAHEASRVYPVKYINMAKDNGIEYDTFRQRIKAGWDLEFAATKQTMTRSETGLISKEKRQRFISALFVRR